MTVLRKPLVGQILRFGVAGSLSFCIDYGTFIFLVRVVEMNYALAAVISFTLSVVFNWAINTRWVFRGAKLRKKGTEIITFILIAVVGLGVNELILWVGIEFLELSAESAKLIATVLVAVWNFVMRKALLYR